MKEIKLTQGKVALVSDEDYEELNRYKWYASKDRHTFYAIRKMPTVRGKQEKVWMHRVIMQTPKGMETDHIDNDELNNQRDNLRICTHSQNQRNRGKTKNNTSGLKGVGWSVGAKKWRSRIGHEGRLIYLGVFSTKEEAYKTYCEASKKYHGEFSRVHQ